MGGTPIPRGSSSQNARPNDRKRRRRPSRSHRAPPRGPRTVPIRKDGLPRAVETESGPQVPVGGGGFGRPDRHTPHGQDCARRSTAPLRHVLLAATIPLNRFSCCSRACGDVAKARSCLSIMSAGVSPRPSWPPHGYPSFIRGSKVAALQPSRRYEPDGYRPPAFFQNSDQAIGDRKSCHGSRCRESFERAL